MVLENQLIVYVVLALLVGFDKSIDYQWSASRIIAFQPWFLMGYYFRRAEGLRSRWKEAGRTCRAVVLGFAALCCGILLIQSDLGAVLLYFLTTLLIYCNFARLVLHR